MTECDDARFTSCHSPASLGHMRGYVTGRAFA